MLEIAEKDQHANWYPAGVCEWEMKRGIVRQEINGMLHIIATNWDATNAQLDREQKERVQDYRTWLFCGQTIGFTDWLKERKETRDGRNG